MLCRPNRLTSQENRVLDTEHLGNGCGDDCHGCDSCEVGGRKREVSDERGGRLAFYEASESSK